MKVEMPWSAILTAIVEEGLVSVCVAVDHCTTECSGLHAVMKVARLANAIVTTDRAFGLYGGFKVLR
jgi:hypothetical protein